MYMSTSKTRCGEAVLTAAALICFVCIRAEASRLSEAQDNYKQQKATCLNGTSNEDRATCLKEANAALAEAKRGRLDDHQQTLYKKNALARCERLPQEDRDACSHRMSGDGLVTGSVAAGGLYREYREFIAAPAVLPAEPIAPISAAPASSATPTEIPPVMGQ